MILLTQGDKIVARCKSKRSAIKHLEHRHPNAEWYGKHDDGADGSCVVSLMTAPSHYVIYRLYAVRPYRVRKAINGQP